MVMVIVKLEVSTIGIEWHVGTYDARDPELSRASRHRHREACWDLCCPRLKVVKGELP